MRKIFRSFLTSALLAAGTPALAAYHIMLDPGHGGTDTGAVRGPAREAELVLHVAQDLKTLLAADPQFSVSMTRTTDVNLSLPERVKKAEKAKADLFVSLHANAAADARAKGVELFFQNSLPPDEESLFLASLENQNIKEAAAVDSDEPSKKGDVAAILEDLHRQYRIESSLRLTQTLSALWDQDGGREKVAIKQAPFYVISKTNMPAVLIEIGFITNPKEVKKLVQPQYQNEIARKIYQALIAYKEKVDKEIPVRQSAE
jgi:N-acetylmuramoyl-L-alanine amidase